MTLTIAIQLSLHRNVTYAPVKFEIATCYSLGVIYKKYAGRTDDGVTFVGNEHSFFS